MGKSKTKVLVFEDFDIKDLKEGDAEALGTALINILTEINDAEEQSNISINKSGDFIVEAEIDRSIIPNQHYKGTIIKIKTYYGK